jgi:putative Holliday junction resolvase
LTRTAAVDYGRRRIGLAVADPLGITVRGLPTVERGADEAEGARRVARALAGEGVGLLVVGLPLHADGRESPMSEEARRFGAMLAAETGLEVRFHDEGLTSWEAEEALKERGIPLEEARRSGRLDQQAAISLLRGWLRDRPASP